MLRDESSLKLDVSLFKLIDDPVDERFAVGSFDPDKLTLGRGM